MPEPKADALERLLEVMADLRHPDTGCPWDLEQDFESIAPHTIEEAYEVADAIARGDVSDGLRDELGDLLLQVVYHAQIARERGLFEFDDVARSIVDKLIRRHPHVFGDAPSPETETGRRASWEAIKARERSDRGEAENDPFAGVPLALPALRRAAKLLSRVENSPEWAARGEDPLAREARDAGGEALGGLEKKLTPGGNLFSHRGDPAHAAHRPSAESRAHDGRGEALGALLFALVALGREWGIDSEAALRRFNRAFEDRVRGGV
jgi:uncharacterized protein YabN with tetrapyrrole methylase and pyrophosphatase domain